MNINLYTGFSYKETYVPKDDAQEKLLQQRLSEINFCIEKNKSLKLINNITILDEQPTYQQLIDLFEPSSLNIIHSPDNFFEDEDLQKIIDIYENYPEDKTKLVLAITRHEYVSEKNIIFRPMKDSQDAHVFFGRHEIKLHESRMSTQIIRMGYRGCDNRLAQELIHARGYKLYNPCHDINVFHFHNSDVRPSLKTVRNNFNSLDFIPVQLIHGPYEFVQPCRIQDIPSIKK